MYRQFLIELNTKLVQSITSRKDDNKLENNKTKIYI